METPALCGLQKLAYPGKQRQAGRLVVLLLLALAAAAAIGAFTGTAAGAHRVIRRLVGGEGMGEERPDYAVTIEIGVTAENAAMALDDIRNRCPWNADVKNLGSGEIVGVIRIASRKTKTRETKSQPDAAPMVA